MVTVRQAMSARVIAGPTSCHRGGEGVIAFNLGDSRLDHLRHDLIRYRMVAVKRTVPLETSNSASRSFTKARADGLKGYRPGTFDSEG